jgi:hypothetical protein
MGFAMKRAHLTVIAHTKPHDEAACHDIHRLDTYKHRVSDYRRMYQEEY